MIKRLSDRRNYEQNKNTLKEYFIACQYHVYVRVPVAHYYLLTNLNCHSDTGRHLLTLLLEVFTRPICMVPG